MEEYLAINHMQRKLNAANPIHGAVLNVAQVASENAKLLLTNPSAAQTISGQNVIVASAASTSGTTTVDSPSLILRGSQWNVSANNYDLEILNDVTAAGASPTGRMVINMGGAARYTLSSAYTMTLGPSSSGAVISGATLSSSNAAGTNIGGSDLTIAAGTSTGTGTGGKIYLKAGGSGVTGSAANAVTTRVTIDNSAVTLADDLVVNGGDITTTATTFNLLNATATTVNFAGAATSLNLGAATGIATIKNASVVLDGDLQVKGGDITTTVTTFALVDTTATTVNFAGAAATLNVADDVTAPQTVNLATGATASAATKAVNIGTGGLAGSTTTVTLGASAGTSTVAVNGNATVSNNLTVDGGTLHVDATNNRVGIGTSSPSYPVDINFGAVAGSLQVGVTNSSTDPAADARVTLFNSATNGGVIQRGSGHATEASDFVLFSAANDIHFYTSASNRMTLTSGGNLTVDSGTLFVDAANNRVGVGTTTPSEPLHVVGNGKFTTVNKITLTEPATSAILTLANGSTLATAGAFSTTLTATAATNVTLPTTGTLATLAGTETLTNKTLTSPTLNSPSVGTLLTLGAASVKMATNAGVTINTATATLVDSFLNSEGSGGEYLIHASTSTGRTVVKILVVLLGSTVETVEYGRVEVGTPISMTFAAAMNGNTMELKATCANAASASVTVKTVRTLF